MGYRRGGLYSYDWLDRLFGFLDRPSANSVLPQFQKLVVGDKIPIGNGLSYPVGMIQPNESLVLDMRGLMGFNWVWQFSLYPVGHHKTQLVSRSRVRSLSLWTRPLVYLIELPGFIMTRRMLIGLKMRAEKLSLTYQNSV